MAVSQMFEWQALTGHHTRSLRTCSQLTPRVVSRW